MCIKRGEIQLLKLKVGILALTLLSSVTLASPVLAATRNVVKPTVDMVALSFSSVSNNSFLHGGTDPFNMSRKPFGFNFLVNELPSGNDYFWTFVDIEALPKGKYVIKVVLDNANGKFSKSASTTYVAGGNNSYFYMATNWKDVHLSQGYNFFKVFLNGKYIGQSLYWGV